MLTYMLKNLHICIKIHIGKKKILFQFYNIKISREKILLKKKMYNFKNTKK